MDRTNARALHSSAPATRTKVCRFAKPEGADIFRESYDSLRYGGVQSRVLPGGGLTPALALQPSLHARCHAGTQGAPAFIAGFLIGDLVWFTVAATGLAALAQSAYAVFCCEGRVSLTCCISRTACGLPRRKLPVADSDEVTVAEADAPLPPHAVTATMGNPKTMVFFLALLPTVVKPKRLHRGGFEIAAVIWCGVAGGARRMAFSAAAGPQIPAEPACHPHGQLRRRHRHGRRFCRSNRYPVRANTDRARPSRSRILPVRSIVSASITFTSFRHFDIDGLTSGSTPRPACSPRESVPPAPRSRPLVSWPPRASRCTY